MAPLQVDPPSYLKSHHLAGHCPTDSGEGALFVSLHSPSSASDSRSVTSFTRLGNILPESRQTR